ncbi:MAG TPA: SpoIIE family protein phosphatase, partial [Candidatus Eisenbacteria bacterium]|nr:SpoIIE family protein phosphatase [Candidatus Eisenbacteria bacterium]
MENQTLTILLIADDSKFARQITEMLAEAKEATFKVAQAAQLTSGLERLAQGNIDLVMLDLFLAAGAGIANVVQVQAQAPRVPIIVVCDLDDERVAVEAVHEGAQDYLVKGKLNPQLLRRSIRYAIERQRADAALLEAEAKYHGIFEHIVEGIFQTSPAGRYLSANSALVRMYGYASAKELMESVTDIGRSLYVEEGRRDEFIRIMQEHDTVTDFESRIFRKDGSIIWIAENVRAIRDAKGNLLYYEGTVEDITARKLADEKLQNSEHLYHSLVETLPQNIFRKDLQERFTFANQRFCQTLGKTLEEIVGKTDFDFFPPELAQKYQQDDRRVIETGQLFETVEENRPPGRETIFVQVVKTPLHDARGQIIGLQGIFWDITERRRAEEQIRKANEELARSREALRQKNQQMEDDLKMAREIQLTMLPQQYPSFPRDAAAAESALRFCHRYQSSGAVGGDFFNVLALSDTKAGVFICDVMGHSVRSALITAMVRALVEELKPLADEPGQLLTKLNRDLCAILRHTGSPMLTTAFYLVADLASGQMRFANAGHPKQLLVHRHAGIVQALSNANGQSRPALGLFEDATYSTTESELTADDLIMLFTDGLYEVEGPGDVLYSHEMLVAAVQKRMKLPAPALFDELLVEIQQFAEGREFADDVCLVGMEVVAPTPKDS